jgi:hypothetical protein
LQYGAQIFPANIEIMNDLSWTVKDLFPASVLGEPETKVVVWSRDESQTVFESSFDLNFSAVESMTIVPRLRLLIQDDTIGCLGNKFTDVADETSINGERATRASLLKEGYPLKNESESVADRVM